MADRLFTYLGDNSTHVSTAGMVHLSLEGRLRGTYVAGVMGSGKSTLLKTMIDSDLSKGIGVFVVDPHGDLIDDILDLVGHYNRQADVRLLDLQNKEIAFGLNVFSCVDPSKASRTANRVVEVFKKVWGDNSWGPRLEDLLANAAFTLVTNPGATLADLPGLLTDPAKRKRYFSRLPPGVVRDYWIDEYDQMKPGMQQQVYGPLMNKVRAFLRDPDLYAIVSQRESSLDLRQAIEENLIVLVRLDAGEEEATSLLGGVLLQQIQEAAFARRDMSLHERSSFMIYFDECHLFATPTFVKLLREVRKFGIGVTAATQFHSVLPDDVATVFSGSSTVVCFRLAEKDARQLQGRFDRLSLHSESPIFDPDPLGTLLSKGHPNANLVAKAKEVETMLTHWQREKDQYLKIRSVNYHVPSLQSYVKRLKSSLDAWLFAYMSNTIQGRQDLMDDLRECLYIDPKAPDRQKHYMAMLDPIWTLAKALEASPLLMNRGADRGRIVHDLTHLPNFTAFLSYQRDGVPSETLLHTLEPPPHSRFRPRPIGVKRVAPPPPPPEVDESVFFDNSPEDDPPPFFESR